jgi:formate dehydrogenase major subunit
MFKNIPVENDEPNIEDITREFNRGMWTVGYTGQSPERLKLHMAEPAHLRPHHASRPIGGPADGDYYGMPWPCWGTAEMKHPGTPNLYDTSKPVAEGGLASAPASAWSATATTCWRKAPIRWARRSRTATPSSPPMLKQLGWGTT